MERPQRKALRLEGYDYSQEGAYFVTICTYERVHLFGDIVNGGMQLSDVGKIAYDLWTTIPDHHPHIVLDAYVVMPNHMHGILFIVDQPNKQRSNVGTMRASSAATLPQMHSKGAHSGSLGAVIGSYKSAVVRSVNKQIGLLAPMIWQSRFHDHIIRNDENLNYIREYVYTNPSRWSEDTFYKNV